MTEVPSFQQEDLLNDEVYVLDCYSQIFIWIVLRSNKFEVNGAHKKTEQYIKVINDNRDKRQVHIIEVFPCKEPSIFKVQFQHWSDTYAKSHWINNPFNEIKNQHTPEAHEERKM